MTVSPSRTTASLAPLNAATARAIALIGSAILLSPTLGFGLGFDHGFFHLETRMAARGLWPYADVFDTAFPGVLLVHAPTLLWAGSPLSLRIIDFLIQMGAVLLIFEASRRLANTVAGAMGALLYASTYAAAGYYHTAQRDGFAVPLLVGLLLILGRGSLAELSKRRLALAGGLLGAACLLRPTYALVAVVVGLIQLRGIRVAGHAGKALLRLLCFVAPVAAPVGAFFAVYALAGRLGAVEDTLLFTATVYPELERASPVRVVHTLFYWAPQMLWLGVILSVWPIFRPASRPMEMWTWTLLLLMLAIRLIESKSYHYQWWPAWAFAAVLAGAGFGGLIVRARQADAKSSRWYTALLVVLLGVVFPMVSLKPLGIAFRDLPAGLRAATDGSSMDGALLADVPGQVAVAQYLRGRVPPGYPIQLWGLYPMVYFVADRPPASRFIVSTAFVCVDRRDNRIELVTTCETRRSKALQQRFLREYLDDLKRRHPYIVTRDSAGSLEIVDGAHGATDFPELREILKRDYRVEARINGWAVFRWRDHSP